MFVSSEWEPDVPKDDVIFGKKASKKKIPKNITTTSNQVAPVENGNKQTKTKGFPIKNQKKKYEKPVTPTKPIISPIVETSEQTTKSKKRKRKNNKKAPGLGILVRNPSAMVPKSLTDTISHEKVDKSTEKKKSNENSSSVSKPSEATNKTSPKTNKNKSKKRKLEVPLVPEAKKLKLSDKSKQKLQQSLDNPDELLLNVNKKQLNDVIKTEDREDLLFKETSHKTRGQIVKSKERLKKILNIGLDRNSVKASGNKLRERMLEKLKAAQFRYLNEKLYTSSGSEAQQLFREDPAAFHTYHQGYQLQVKKWPVNPLDVIVTSILKMPKSITIADMGCGEAVLSTRVPHTVRSFDLVAKSPRVEACDMAHTPLVAASVDVAVYCLALMGTDLTQYLVEANRVLKQGGLLLIAEVESRFDDVDAFTKDVAKLGFKLLKLDKSNQMFFFMEFRKMQPPPAKKNKQPALTLKPCIYKRR